MFLYGVVGEMNKLVIEVLELEGFAACADVALFVPIAFEDAVDAGEQDVMPDVEFATAVEKGLVYVGLDYIGECISVLVLLAAQALLDSTERRKLNCLAAVRILSWFYYPYSCWILSILPQKLFEFFAIF